MILRSILIILLLCTFFTLVVFDSYIFLISNSNHTGFDTYILIYFNIIILLIDLLLLIFFQKKMDKPGIFIAICIIIISFSSILNVIIFDKYNVMVQYDRWAKRGMPLRWELR